MVFRYCVLMRCAPHRRIVLGGLAAGGVVVAHWLAYFFAAPEAHTRAELLEHTGHQRWTIVSAIALALLTMSLGRAAWAGLSGAEPTAALLDRRIFPRLALIQTIGFVALEGLERSVVTGSAAGLFAEPAVVMGIGLQIAAALAGAVLLTLVVKVVDRLTLVRPAAPRLVQTRVRPPVVFHPRSLEVAVGGGTLRGPPRRLQRLTHASY